MTMGTARSGPRQSLDLVRAPLPSYPLNADQPVGAAFGARGFDEQIVDVGFAVGDVGQAGLGEPLGQGVDTGKAIDPADAFFFFEWSVGIFLLPQAAGLADQAVQVK